jgi:hypothetical protein
MQARIKEKREVAKGTLLVTFDLLGEEVAVTSPNERGVLGFATRMRDSAFKGSLSGLPVGTEVEV